jgi:hypothetical protein
LELGVDVVTAIEDRPSLKDLDGVRVAVEETAPARTCARHHQASRRSAAACRGHQESSASAISRPAILTCESRSRASSERNGLVAADVQLDFVQIVFLRRNPQVTFNRAQTWKADARRSCSWPRAQLAREIERELRSDKSRLSSSRITDAANR